MPHRYRQVGLAEITINAKSKAEIARRWSAQFDCTTKKGTESCLEKSINALSRKPKGWEVILDQEPYFIFIWKLAFDMQIFLFVLLAVAHCIQGYSFGDHVPLGSAGNKAPFETAYCNNVCASAKDGVCDDFRGRNTCAIGVFNLLLFGQLHLSFVSDKSQIPR